MERSKSPDHDRPRILVLTTTFPRWRGDTQPRFVFDLSRGLADRFGITVLAPHAPGARHFERWDGVEVRRFQYVWPTRWEKLSQGGILPTLRRRPALRAQVPALVTAQLLAAIRLARSSRVDLIHAHWTLPQGLVGAIVKGLRGVRGLIVTAHGADLYGLRSPLARRLKRWALSRSDRVTTVSRSLANEVRDLGVAGAVTEVIPMGVDTEAFSPERAHAALRARYSIEGPFLLFVGRLAEKKGARYLIEALPRIIAALPDATLVIVGDGPERERLSAQCRRLGVTGHVIFAGAVPHDHLPTYFAAADLFVGPSIVADSGDTEAFGLVFAEAMACGCPVIATDVGGISDLVLSEETGLLIPQKDEQAIADAVIRLLQDAAERGRLRKNGLAWVRERFDLSKTTSRYARLMEEVLAA